MILVDAVRQRLGEDAISLDHTFRRFTQDPDGVTAVVEHSGSELEIRADVLVGCDGVHSAVRRQLHPGEEGLLYSGYTMWRGATRHTPILTGASMIRAGLAGHRQDGRLPDPGRHRRPGTPAHQLGGGAEDPAARRP
ncbi:FAD-dependent monooxygenase [Actinomadura madurae]|uniref:FAD-dependent monooxygenase n=1 Tax=Actinomadura madurae TaxID=1993 RepID=UPI0020D20375|nr:FAD-dependent monooxygenase [Actinomadura madurae]MCP9977432.1 FAD-dependent monooxygenase [Actinomadura madurae]